ncbi:MAG: hypothetical protein WC804_17130 [Sphingomonas sp.]|jgi:hypothetical protein|uniref:hypothetical protein n=1 Tax=Sphingomonas sp. TaxID=28214 RepID=UPI0035683990
MARVTPRLINNFRIAGAVGLLSIATAAPPQAPEKDPIAYIGHGAFFDAQGNQLVPTVEFVAAAQSYYRAVLLRGLDGQAREKFALFERRLAEAAKAGGDLDAQSTLVVHQRSLDWLVANVRQLDDRIAGKIRLLAYRLSFNLPTDTNRKSGAGLTPFVLAPGIIRLLDSPDFKPDNPIVFLATMNKGQAYINECAAKDVPIPPPIGQLDPAGTAGWKTQGFIPTGNQFIAQDFGPSPAEIRTFENANGMCIALPRYSDTGKSTVVLDGVICLSNKPASNVCIWDNQMNGTGFSFAAGTKIPIGVPDLAVNPSGKYQAGGYELLGGTGGVCTDCHAGENPYIVHPDVTIAPGKTMGDLGATLPMFAPNRYDPIVPASWPQNALSQSPALVPPACKSCHVKGGAGRLPHLSNQLQGYCNTILSQAVGTAPPPTPFAPPTMPQGSPGSALGTPALNTLLSWCGSAPSAGPSDRGDPHLITTNGIKYDFQAAGEFTALRNSDTGFELQTRQTPVTTTFIPDANPYTGLQSCVSLNTAVAVRIGRHRITYQPSVARLTTAEQMRLRVDGRPVVVPANGLALGAGNLIAKAASGGGLSISLADGTRVLVTPTFWSSQGYWYLDVEVLNTPAREGTMGHVAFGNWLPLAPDGSSFGGPPASLGARYLLLNKTFANAWRVSNASSLFDYAPGTTTTTFTDPAWPPKPGTACTAAKPMPGIPNRRPVAPLKPEEAARLCRRIEDKAVFAECVFDVTVTGNAGMIDGYQRTLALRKAAMTTLP